MSGVFDFLTPKPAAGGARRSRSKSPSRKAAKKSSKKPASAKKTVKYVKTKKTVKCGDGQYRSVYMKSGKAYYHKKDPKTGKLVWRRAPVA